MPDGSFEKRENNVKIKQRVQAGVRMLDQKLGSTWRKNINLERFNLMNTRCCMLGQLFGSYSRGVQALGLTGDYEAVACGFESKNWTFEEFGELTREWKLVVASSRCIAKTA